MAVQKWSILGVWVRAEEHDAAIAALTAERDDLQARLGPRHPYKEGCYCSPCMIERQQERIRELEARCERLTTAIRSAMCTRRRRAGRGSK
jgi:hypothetical protein